MTAATCNTHTTITEPVQGPRPEWSIRQICLHAIMASEETPKLAQLYKDQARELIEQQHGTSAAARKFGKHYAWYKATLKKEGKIVGAWTTK